MKVRRWLLVMSLLLIVALAAGCAPLRSAGVSTSSDYEMPAATQAPALAGQRAVEAEESKGSEGYAPAAEPAPGNDSYSTESALSERMIIRTVNLTLVVEDVEKSTQEFMTLVTTFQGYVAGSNLWRDGTQTYSSITLRVPAESLDALVEALRSRATRIDNQSISTDDVSQEYVDLSSRLRNLEATEKELLEVLDNIYEKSYKAEDVISIYREITQIRGEIEQIKGRQQYLEQLTALATVQVNLQPVATPPSVVEEGKWSPKVIINTALRNLVRIFQGLYEVIVVVVLNVLPVLVLLALPVVAVILLVRAARRRKANKQTPPQS